MAQATFCFNFLVCCIMEILTSILQVFISESESQQCVIFYSLFLEYVMKTILRYLLHTLWDWEDRNVPSQSERPALPEENEKGFRYYDWNVCCFIPHANQHSQQWLCYEQTAKLWFCFVVKWKQWLKRNYWWTEWQGVTVWGNLRETF